MIEIKDYTSKNPDGTVERVLNYASSFLGLEGIIVTVAKNAALLKKLSTKDIDFEAILVPSGMEHSYTLYITDVGKKEQVRILAHEAIHMWQQEKGDLIVDPVTYECRWKGEKYTNDYPYMDRPWEKEAFKTQAEILKAYKASQKAEKGGKQPGCLLFVLLFVIVSVSLWML